MRGNNGGGKRGNLRGERADRPSQKMGRIVHRDKMTAEASLAGNRISEHSLGSSNIFRHSSHLLSNRKSSSRGAAHTKLTPVWN